MLRPTTTTATTTATTPATAAAAVNCVRLSFVLMIARPRVAATAAVASVTFAGTSL